MYVLIRPATPADVRSIYQFICNLEEQSFDFEAFKDLFVQNLHHPNCHYLVADCQQQTVGYAAMHAQILLHHCGKVGEIQEMYVLPTHRNLGIGQQLLAELVAIATREQYVLLEVTANQKRLDTHRFYQKNGFSPTHLKFVKEL